MANLILHKDGAYNIYTTICDGTFFDSALTLEQLTEYIKETYGTNGLRILPERLKRAHATGYSGLSGLTLDDCIRGNHCGPNGTTLPHDEFIARFLTFGPENKTKPDVN